MIITHDNNEDNGCGGGLDNIDYDNGHYGDQNNWWGHKVLIRTKLQTWNMGARLWSKMQGELSLFAYY